MNMNPQELAFALTQPLVEAEPSRPIPRERIAELADSVLGMPHAWISQVDREPLIAKLEAHFNVWIGEAQILTSKDHRPWLSGYADQINWRYWNRYRKLLERSLPLESVKSLDSLTNDILDRIENPDPSNQGSWDSRGLVVGHVQSGKTANYSGLICKAADAGYRLIIVLSGLHNNLRSQTQIRLDYAFLGYESKPLAQATQVKAVGVGLIDPNCPRPDTITNRTESGDFRRQVADHFSINPGNHPLLFVVKKNAKVLQNLLGWVDWAAVQVEEGSDRKLVRNVPILVIDDE
ncbi:MAG: endonuclease, partial [Verrucomicrobiaceae bacterium]